MILEGIAQSQTACIPVKKIFTNIIFRYKYPNNKKLVAAWSYLSTIAIVRSKKRNFESYFLTKI